MIWFLVWGPSDSCQNRNEPGLFWSGQREHKPDQHSNQNAHQCSCLISRLLLGSDSSCRSLQVGTGSHDHQQQHQQTHLLLSWLMLQKLRRLTTLGLYLWIKDEDLRIWIEIYFPRSLSEHTHYWPKHPARDFLGHHGLSLVEGYFNSWDAGDVTETSSPFSLLPRNPISPLIIIDF